MYATKLFNAQNFHFNWLHGSRFTRKIHAGNALTKKTLFFSVMPEIVHFPQMRTLQWHMMTSKFVVDSLDYLLETRHFPKCCHIVKLHTDYCGNALTFLHGAHLKCYFHNLHNKQEMIYEWQTVDLAPKWLGIFSFLIKTKTLIEIWWEPKVHFLAILDRNASFWLATTIYSRSIKKQTRQVDAEYAKTYLKTWTEHN